MLFDLSSPLPEQMLPFKRDVERVCNQLAAGLPRTRVYSEAQLFAIIGPAQCGDTRLAQTLVDMGVLTRQVTQFWEDTDFTIDEGWREDSPEELLSEDTRYVVEGRLVKLIDDLKRMTGAAPYFISFYTAEGLAYAEKLHQALQAAGITGFLSAEMTSGTMTKSAMISALRSAGTVILIESPGYHTRSVCQAERDFAVARGARVLRVGTCSRGQLIDCPAWLNDHVQYENFVSGTGFALQQQLLGTPVPAPVNLDARRRAAMSLLDRTNGVDDMALAAKLTIQNRLTGSELEKKGQICSIAFANGTQANRFCAEFDLAPLF